MEIRKAERRKARLRLGIASTSGAGKTYSALLLAFGLGGKVGLIDTENGSGDLYAHLGEYDIIPLQAPYTVAKYREAIKVFETAGYNTIIIDSLTHAWAGEGGLLDKQGKMADAGGNSYTAWRKVTPDHNALVEAMLQSPSHIIATMRSKTEYVLEKDDKGKMVPRKVGMAPVQREGMEYEFTVMMDISMDHIAHTTKDRTSLLDGQFFKITSETGKLLNTWLESGKDAPKLVVPAAEATVTGDKGGDVRAMLAAKPEAEVKKVSGIIDSVKTANVAGGKRYGIKLQGADRVYGTASVPAASKAEKLIGKKVDISYQEQNGKFALVGFDSAKA